MPDSLPSMAFGLLPALAVLLVAAGPSAPTCDAVLPGPAWDEAPIAGVVVGVAAVPDGLAERFRREVAAGVEAIDADLGVHGVVCIFGREAGVGNAGGLAPGRLQAAVVGEEAAVLVAADHAGRTGPAAVEGLAHLALWQASGGLGWPEPQATAIARWYADRVAGRTASVHVAAKFANFMSIDPVVAWSSDRQDPVRLWDPERAGTLLSDLVDATVAAEGTEFLLDTDPEAWREREAAWRFELRRELTGLDAPTTGWKWGVGLGVGILVVAGAVALAGYLEKRRRRRRPPTPPPVPGLFTGVQSGEEGG